VRRCSEDAASSRRARTGSALGGSLDLHQFRLAQRGNVFDQPRRRLAEHHSTRLRDGLHPLSHADLTADCGVTAWPGADLTRDDLARAQAHSQLDGDIVGRGSLALDIQCCQARAKSMVLQRYWCAEDRHDAVTGELVHRPAIPLHHGRTTVKQLGHNVVQPLGAHSGGDIHGSHHIDEQHRDLFVLGGSMSRRDGCTTLEAELGVLRQLGAAHDACGHVIASAIAIWPS
jgi:hypothetical protein